MFAFQCSQEVTLEVFRRLRKEETLDEGHVAKSKVLIVSHDVSFLEQTNDRSSCNKASVLLLAVLCSSCEVFFESLFVQIPQRLYQHWSYRVLDIEAPLVDEYETTEPHSKLVKDLLTQLLRLGMHLSRQTKVRNFLRKFHIAQHMPVVTGCLSFSCHVCHTQPLVLFAGYFEKCDRLSSRQSSRLASSAK